MRSRHHMNAMTKRLVYICDWLPPDFGAVGQYAVLFARQWASDGWDVTLVGLSSGAVKPRSVRSRSGLARSRFFGSTGRPIRKQKFVARLAWTILSNLLLLARAFRRCGGPMPSCLPAARR